MNREEFICNCFWLVNDSNEREHKTLVWQWGHNNRYIRLEKKVQKGPPVPDRFGGFIYRLYPLLYRYDVVWDSMTRDPKLMFNIYDCEGKRLKMKAVCAMVNIKYKLDADHDDSLEVDLHPILNMPYYCLPNDLLAKPKGEWLDVKNPILEYLLQYAPYFNLSQEELLEISHETPYIE
uniref:Uncharacterized protein n=1 Tax=Anopheles christyi TaxID=43041 RepID=A0A182K788_9DIPT